MCHHSSDGSIGDRWLPFWLQHEYYCRCTALLCRHMARHHYWRNRANCFARTDWLRFRSIFLGSALWPYWSQVSYSDFRRHHDCGCADNGFFSASLVAYFGSNHYRHRNRCLIIDCSTLSCRGRSDRNPRQNDCCGHDYDNVWPTRLYFARARTGTLLACYGWHCSYSSSFAIHLCIVLTTVPSLACDER